MGIGLLVGFTLQQEGATLKVALLWITPSTYRTDSSLLDYQSALEPI